MCLQAANSGLTVLTTIGPPATKVISPGLDGRTVGPASHALPERGRRTTATDLTGEADR